MLAFDLLLGTNTRRIESNLRLVNSMHMFIGLVPAAILACIFTKTLFASAATANQTLTAIYLYH